jgi:hypothetical protein
MLISFPINRDATQSIQIQNASNEADRLAREAGLSHLSKSKPQRTTQRSRPSQPSMNAYLYVLHHPATTVKPLLTA